MEVWHNTMFLFINMCQFHKKYKVICFHRNTKIMHFPSTRAGPSSTFAFGVLCGLNSNPGCSDAVSVGGGKYIAGVSAGRIWHP